MTQEDNRERFIARCKHFEDSLHEHYHFPESQSAYAYFQSRREFERLRGPVNAVRVIRNIFQHNNTTYAGKELLCVSPELTRMLEELIDAVEKPQRAQDLMTSEIHYATAKTRVSEALALMQKEQLSHIPILENRAVCGVFSENALFSRLLEERTLSAGKGETIAEYRKWTQLQAHTSHAFDFVSRLSPAGELYERFEEKPGQTKKLAMLFVTEHGKPGEPLLGLITPWDLLQK